MTESELSFGGIARILANWPAVTVPAQAQDGLFERARQMLSAALASRTTPIPADFAPVLRHILRRESLQSGNNAVLRIPLMPGWPTADDWSRFGILAHSQTKNQVLVEAAPWSPGWLPVVDTPVFDDAFRQHQVRKDFRTLADPFIADASGFPTYVSAGQREAVRSAFLMRPGHTLIVCLPTGSGKSFVGQAPILARGREGGLTLCIVPTTALVLDQARQMAERLSERSRGVSETGLAWHSGLKTEEKDQIKAAIREGRQGILYCSPEAVIGALLPALYDAAKRGLFDYLFVDEAHLLSQWGDGFRPAFQIIAGIRRGLLRECSGAKFRTILMSATLTTEAIETIDALFGPPETVDMVASVHLRPEPQYWIHNENSSDAKIEKVLEAVRHAPRPMILYVTKRSDAADWCRRLRKQGFERVEMFHGETPDGDRSKIIEDWAQDRLDIVVATSAFGVGIDKSDVRAVIHAAVPETVDRFYQEVGRGGRDGAPAGSLMIYSKVDVEVAKGIASPSLISDDLAFDRWSAMFRGSEKLDAVGRRLKVDVSTVPPKLRRQTDYNQAWNMRTLIMMARAGLLDLDAVAPDNLERDADETEADFDKRSEDYWSTYYARCIVDVNFANHLDRADFSERIADERSRAFKAAETNGDLLQTLLRDGEEMGQLLHRLYQSYRPGRAVVVSRACGGCATHRREGAAETDYAEPAVSGLDRIVDQDVTLWRVKFPHLKLGAPIILILPDPWDDAVAISVVADAVTAFNVQEVGVSRRLRMASPLLNGLHKRSDTGMLFLETLEDEARILSQAPLMRVTVLNGSTPPAHVFDILRPVHLIVAPEGVPDPRHPIRNLGEVGDNILTLEQFRAGARQ